MSSAEPNAMIMEATWHVDDSQLDRWTKGATFIRAETARIVFKFTNKGGRRFVGGRITKFRVSVYGSALGSLSIGDNVLPRIPNDIPPLEPQASHSFETDYTPTIEGVGWWELTVVSSDNTPIKFQEGLPVNEGGFAFQVVSRELILLLEKVDKLLNK